MELTRQEKQFRLLMIIWALTFLVGIAAALLPPFLLPALAARDAPTLLRPYLPEITAFYSNKLLVVAAMAAETSLFVLAFLVAFAVRENASLVDVAVAAKLAFILGFGYYALFTPQSRLMRMTLISGALFDVLQMTTMLVFRDRAIRSRFGLAYLSGARFLTLTKLAEVTLPDPPGIRAEDVARNIDRYLSLFRSRRKRDVRLLLFALEYFPLVYLRPPFSRMGRLERRAFIRRRFYRSRGYLRDLIRAAKQIVFLGYYSDPRTYPSVGFTEFVDRPRGVAAENEFRQRRAQAPNA